MSQIRADAGAQWSLQRTGTCHACEKTGAAILDRGAQEKISTTLINSATDAVLVDVGASTSQAAVLVRQIRLSAPRSAIVAIVDSLRDSELSMLRQAGITAFLPKSASAAELFRLALSTSCSSGGNLEAPIRGVQKLTRQRKDACLDSLTRREKDMLKGIAAGKNNREIAIDFGLSVQTVKAHLKNVFTKLNCRSRTAALITSLREGLLSPNDICRRDQTDSYPCGATQYSHGQLLRLVLRPDTASRFPLTRPVGAMTYAVPRIGDSVIEFLLDEIDQQY